MNESERNRLMNELRRMIFAQSDMAQAAMAAQSLITEHHNGDLCRALETAIAVCYARSFAGGNNAGTLGEEWFPEGGDQRAMHEAIVALRDEVFAHNDRTHYRGIVDAGALLGEPEVFAEEWLPIKREVLPAFIQMCAYQQTRFRIRGQELQ